MTNQEAIKKFEKSIASYTEAVGRSAETDEVIVAFRHAVDALKKQEPMKPMLNFVPSRLDRLFGTKQSGYTCRHCGNACLTREISERNETYYCWHCGQKLDWTGGDDNADSGRDGSTDSD